VPSGFSRFAPRTADLIDNLQGGLQMLLKRRCLLSAPATGAPASGRREETTMGECSPVDLFTPEEDSIFFEWFRGEVPKDLDLPPISSALERLGLGEGPERPYSNLDAAVAFIVLEAVEKRLPQWAAVGGGEVQFARDYRPKELVPARRAAMIPQHLFTLNWADSGPGFSWPAAYYATWVPTYDRFVVMVSADCPDAFGYTDIAIGHFGKEESLLEGSRRIVVEDWRYQIGEWDQGRWAYLFFEGLLNEAGAESWADEAWGKE